MTYIAIPLPNGKIGVYMRFTTGTYAPMAECNDSSTAQQICDALTATIVP